ncbi:2-oxoglutarate and iron-dependent oxygenase domain-containing protein [Chitinivorax sp. B]|uniref:isopenicillin N synthase family dioxygenase n=1 Tax=Chitinivorax sp. B TaxID=2502235 RepID=UPI0010F70F9A|nr:2-oxoglutarate and iron-dependent oxygenase domain-containing protein [Chitinivorax sp. B]
MSIHHLPTLNLADFQHAATRPRFLAELRAAARDIGFFYLTGHGVDDDLQQQALAISRQFFLLPTSEKLQVQMANSPHFRGYTRIGGELTRGQQDWREQFDVMRESIAWPQHDPHEPWRRLQGPNQWPAALPEMKRIILSWQDQLTQVTLTLLRAFALALAQPEGAFEQTVRDGAFQHLKLIRYPGRDQAGSNQGVGAHKDSGYLTLVLQDEQPGLEVLIDEQWVPATPKPGSFVVNIGELLELASDGYLRATLHRVVTPPAGTERLSCAFFMAAQLDATVPLLTLPPQLAAEARGPASDPHNALFYEVGRNVLKGRLRSHPDVANRHYHDLVAA